MKSETRQCQSCKSDFALEPADFAFYEKLQVPAPTFCPDCRLQRRLAFRNERALYKRPCGLCGRDFIGQYAPDAPFPVYCAPCWWSDSWDATEHGQEYDFKKPFFEQFFELSKKVPHMGTFTSSHTTMVNSEYTNLVGNLKNCYLIFNADYNEGCCYGTEIESSKECFDNLMIEGCELCHECVNCRKCYRTFFSIDCESCVDVWFSRNCAGCSDCFGCVNLRKKKYHFLNEPLSEGEYKKKIAEIRLNPSRIREYMEARDALALKLPFKFAHALQNKNFSGDYIYNCKNTRDSYIMTGAENCRFAMWGVVPSTKDVYDWTEWGNNVELAYECMGIGENARNCRFTRQSLNAVRDLEYCLYCVSSSNLFGCASVKKNEYCILNKKYSKEDFEALRGKIIEQMNEMPYVSQRAHSAGSGQANSKEQIVYRYGEFFPIEHSQYSYNETNAQEHFSLTKEAAVAAGYRWRDPEEKSHQPTLASRDIPDIEDAQDSIVNEIIGCEHKMRCDHRCTKAFRIIPQEFAFYRKMNLPLPRLCPNCRHYERVEQRNPVKLWQRSCQCAGEQSDGGTYRNTAHHRHGQSHCAEEFETSYSPDRSEIVYCEQCYQAEAA